MKKRKGKEKRRERTNCKEVRFFKEREAEDEKKMRREGRRRRRRREK